jgi:uncharacterized protein (TIGR00369 family)
MPKVTADELNAFFQQAFAKNSMVVEELSESVARLRHPIEFEHLRPGETVLGPILMAVADTAAFAVVLANVGLGPFPATSSLNIHFLKRPPGDRDILAEASLLKPGRRLAVVEVTLTSDGVRDPVAHSTVTYSIPTREV